MYTSRKHTFVGLGESRLHPLVTPHPVLTLNRNTSVASCHLPTDSLQFVQLPSNINFRGPAFARKSIPRGLPHRSTPRGIFPKCIPAW